MLGLLFGNSGRSFYATEILSLTGAGTGAVQRELARLESAGLVTVTRVGKEKHYQANTSAPAFEPLRELVQSLRSCRRAAHRARAARE